CPASRSRSEPWRRRCRSLCKLQWDSLTADTVGLRSLRPGWCLGLPEELRRRRSRLSQPEGRRSGEGLRLLWKAHLLARQTREAASLLFRLRPCWFGWEELALLGKADFSVPDDAAADEMRPLLHLFEDLGYVFRYQADGQQVQRSKEQNR